MITKHYIYAQAFAVYQQQVGTYNGIEYKDNMPITIHEKHACLVHITQDKIGGLVPTCFIFSRTTLEFKE